KAVAILLAQLGPQRDRHVEDRGVVFRRMLELDRDLDGSEPPLLAVGVHLDRDRRAARQRGGEQLGRCGPAIVAALTLWLIDDQGVTADLHLVLVALAPTDDGALHQAPSRPSNICGLGSSAKRARAKARSEARLRKRRTASEARPSESLSSTVRRSARRIAVR